MADGDKPFDFDKRIKRIDNDKAEGFKTKTGIGTGKMGRRQKPRRQNRSKSTMRIGTGRMDIRSSECA